ncbi:hypothetical protein CISG_01299 [Coccidioides immitis RMSCC 3703]|uniref:Uncharacterized protein n=1 Tax=Coccidioides immitis RMSCC 3703 TaxID=454286 RepID=A0A0J8QYJ6_COCIT|nr:hypothetical protein CISG_01299 [Coccidioides immitis RMSCC 3703]
MRMRTDYIVSPRRPLSVPTRFVIPFHPAPYSATAGGEYHKKTDPQSVPKECRSSSTETLQPSHEVRLHSIARYLQLPEPDRSSLVKAQASNPRTPLGIRYSARSDRLDRDSPQKTRNDRSIDPRHSSRAAPQVGGLKDLLVG